MENALTLIEDTLSSLKDFQRETVKSVIQSFESEESARVLVADEVGLGKTIVAKGVIAELLKARLKQQQTSSKNLPLRVTYICSNLSLADENRKKLAVFHGNAQTTYVREPSYHRLLDTVLVKQVRHDKNKILELCSLTPATSFHLSSGHGNYRERLILYFALIEHDELAKHKRKLSNFFSNSKGGWEEQRDSFLNESKLVKNIISDFHELLNKKIDEETKKHCGIVLPETPDANSLDVLIAFCRNGLGFKKTENRFRSHLRLLLAQSCARYLTADLFILDEFQRFKSLLDTREVKNDNASDEALIAREIFSKQKTKVLLLSATPFKAITRAEDDDEGNAHAEELNYLLSFLTKKNADLLDDYEEHRKALQQQIMKLRDTTFDINSLHSKHKFAIEIILKSYLCRTERVQISEAYEDLFISDVPSDVDRIKDFTRKEIEVFRALDKLGQALQDESQNRSASHLMEFYKSSPWPLSFLSGYEFKKQLDKWIENSSVKKVLKKSEPAWLKRANIQKYTVKLPEAPQAKIRALVKRLFNTPSEELLWVPPSLPHYPLQGSFEGQQTFSKTLLFSSWAMVPRALSGLISYEAERRLLENRKGLRKAYFKDGTHSPSIRFDAKSSLVGWSLVYPSKYLVDMELEWGGDSLTDIIKQRTQLLTKKLNSLRGFEKGSRSGDRWYALAPMLLDIDNKNETYLRDWLQEQEQNFQFRKAYIGIEKQFTMLKELLDEGEELSLGEMPADLAEYLALLSIAGPAITVYRTFTHLWPDENKNAACSAADVAFAMLSMFNKAEAENIFDKRYPGSKYFLAIARYCADGGLQAVIDEYGHLLKDAGFPMTTLDSTSVDSATSRLIEVLSIKTVSVACQFEEHKHKSSDETLKKFEKTNNKHSLRCHYAVPFGNQKLTDDSGRARVSNVRNTFNSPFRPFVLNSTSIGQEGLDFHWYCHQVVHWNLPGNPIDLEQREGRVNRYKSLVVRKRLVEKFRQGTRFKKGDVWKQLFDAADKQTREKGRKSDLVPYWHLPEGTAKISRFVPMLPLSSDVAKLDHFLKVLAIYRLAFGQPRQEELLDNLLKRNFTAEQTAFINKKLVINLSPTAQVSAR